MQTLASLFVPGKRRRAAAQLRLAQAYQATFTGNATSEDAEMVLADLTNVSGFYAVEDANVSATARAFADGRRDLMRRILSMSAHTPEQRQALFQAVQAEEEADNQEGYT